MNKLTIAGVVVGVLILLIGGSLVAATPQGSEISAPTVLAQNGLHWHAKLAITEGGKVVEVPTDVGLGKVHNPIHTHEDRLIHMEFSGQVTENDLRLKNFFSAWNKEFPSEATMTVNGKASSELGEYVMRDGDEVAISY